MTIVAGYISHGDGALLATDSQFTIGEHVEFGATKVRHHRGVYIGAAGPARVFDVIELALSKAFDGRDEIATSVFACEISSAFQRYSWEPEKERGKPAYRDFAALVTDGRRLFEIDPYIHFREVPAPTYVSIGSSEYAYGVFHALVNEDPRGTLRRAVEATCRYDTGCGLPVQMYEVPPAEVAISS